MEKATVVKETVEGNRVFKEMSDGTLRVESVNKPHGALYGDYVTLSATELTDEKLKEAKNLLVKQICGVIEQLAERDDFFIVKKALEGDNTTVGWKIFCPTVEADAEGSMFGEAE